MNVKRGWLLINPLSANSRDFPAEKGQLNRSRCLRLGVFIAVCHRSKLMMFINTDTGDNVYGVVVMTGAC